MWGCVVVELEYVGYVGLIGSRAGVWGLCWIVG